MTRQEVQKYWEQIEDVFRKDKDIVIRLNRSSIDEASRILEILRQVRRVKATGEADALDVLEAFKNGRDIVFYDTFDRTWTQTDDPEFEHDRSYILKPKGEPLDIESAKDYIGKRVFDSDEYVYTLKAVSFDFAILLFCVMESREFIRVDYDDLYEYFTDEDGKQLSKPIN